MAERARISQKRMPSASGASKVRILAGSRKPGNRARSSAAIVRLDQRIEQMFAWRADGSIALERPARPGGGQIEAGADGARRPQRALRRRGEPERDDRDPATEQDPPARVRGGGEPLAGGDPRRG